MTLMVGAKNASMKLRMMHFTNQHMNVSCTICGENVEHKSMLSKHIEDKHLGIAMLSSESPEHKKQTTYPILRNDSHSDDSFENVSIEKEKSKDEKSLLKKKIREMEKELTNHEKDLAQEELKSVSINFDLMNQKYEDILNEKKILRK